MRPKHEAAAFSGHRVCYLPTLHFERVIVIPSPYNKKTHVCLPGGRPRMEELEIGKDFFRDFLEAARFMEPLLVRRMEDTQRDLDKLTAELSSIRKALGQ